MEFTPPKYLSTYFPLPIASFAKWRETVLKPFIIERENWLCWYAQFGECWRNGNSMHEGIITKGDVQGWTNRGNRALINTPYNCILLCQKHHKMAPSKDKVLLWSINEYGLSVLDWLDCLPFSINPVQGLIDYYRKEWECL